VSAKVDLEEFATVSCPGPGVVAIKDKIEELKQGLFFDILSPSFDHAKKINEIIRVVNRLKEKANANKI